MVIGGGLAGISAACHLADRGHPVVLLEKRPFLGGRAFSFTDPETGREMDNGQHVFLGCCTAYIGLLGILGARINTHLQDSLSVPILDGAGRRGVLQGAALPSPFHLLPSLLAYPHLSWMDKLRVLYGGLRIQLANRRRDASSLEYETFAEWLKRHHQSDDAIARFWNLVVLPTLNDDASQVSATMGLKVFQEGVLKSRESGSMGYAMVGLSALVSDGAIDYLSARGGEVMLGAGARELAIEDGRVCGVRTSHGYVDGDWFVLALPSHDLATVLPDELAGDGFFSLAGMLRYSPIVNVHVWYDRPVMDDEFAGFVDSPPPVGLQQDAHAGRLRCVRAVRVHLAQRRLAVCRRAQAADRRDVPGGDGASVPARARRSRGAPVGSEAAQGHLPVGSGRGGLPAARHDAHRKPVSGRRVGSHRLAGHHGGRSAQRLGGCTGNLVKGAREVRPIAMNVESLSFVC